MTLHDNCGFLRKFLRFKTDLCIPLLHPVATRGAEVFHPRHGKCFTTRGCPHWSSKHFRWNCSCRGTHWQDSWQDSIQGELRGWERNPCGTATLCYCERPVQDRFQHPSCAELSAAVDSFRAAGTSETEPSEACGCELRGVHGSDKQTFGVRWGFTWFDSLTTP